MSLTPLQPSDWDLLQIRAQKRIDDAIGRGVKRFCAVATTGFGKTKIIRERMAIPARHVLYTHRRMLFTQLHRTLLAAGIRHGCRASKLPDTAQYLPFEPIQLAMLQTEKSQVEEKQTREYHDADYVYIDELHCNRDQFTRDLIDWHVSQGAIVMGVTATPVGLKDMVDELVELCRNSELRAAKGILPAQCYAPTEVDLSDVKKVSVSGEFNQKQLGKKFAVQQVVASVYEWWMKLNPNADPAVGFTPGVEESKWFVDEFARRGVKTASIDGASIYTGMKDASGERILLPTDQDTRDDIMARSESGEFKVTWNRFVMREGIDAPHFHHAILATAYGTEEGYVQSIGRVLRAYPGMTHVIVQDHGGNIERFGNPNLDRIWKLEDTEKSRTKERQAREEAGVEKPPMICPGCRRAIPVEVWVKSGKKCPVCAYKFASSEKWVIQTNGSLKKVPSVSSKPRVRHDIDIAMKRFDSLYFASKNSKAGNRASTFNQLKTRFHKEHGAQFVIKTAASGATVVVDKHTGDTRVLGNAPSGNSAFWSFKVKDVASADLQGGKGYGKKSKNTESEQRARDGINQLFSEAPGEPAG